MKYKDREGCIYNEDSGQDKFLARMYGSIFGRLVMKALTIPIISDIGGWYLNTGFSKRHIHSFIAANNINMDDYEDISYKSYNDFFKRRIKTGRRPVDDDSSHFISPSDGKISVYPIGDDSVFKIKNSFYTVSTLLHSKRLAQKYKGGYCILVRLTVDDYHRYCYIDDGVKSRNCRIKGRLHTVNPAAVACVPVYKENTREYTVIRTDNFGDIIQMEVGAMMVGRITNYHDADIVKRGQEKGNFEFGGSTVIVLVEKDRIKVRQDLLENTMQDYETIVKMGEMIGTSVTQL